MRLTDQELIKEVAEKVMGWVKSEYGSWLNAPLCPCFKVSLSVNTTSYDKDDGYLMQIPFDPITNANHWMMVVERVLNYSIFIHVDLSYSLGWWSCSFEKLNEWEIYKSDQDYLGRAVCLAALEVTNVN